MANNSMGTKKVEELLVSKSMPLGMQFYVPNYQRGYRWKESQVQQLLNDIKEFDYEKNNEKKFYCLQPLVVTEDKENGWVVIDGQQRLTTLFIILTCIEKMLYKEKAQLYQMNYQNKPQMHDWLEELGDVNNDVQINSDDIDAYHITNAYLTVKAWLEEANDLKAIGAEIREKIRTYTRFIWYEVKGDIKPEIIFTNINMGKIKLTNAELIKALLLKQDNYKGENDDVIKVSQIKISTAWDNMEAKLQRDDLWRFLTGSGKFSKSETHMELIFRIMAKDIVKDRIRNNPEFYVENEEELNKDTYTFIIFSRELEYLENEKTDKPLPYSELLESFWGKIERYYNMFIDWYENREWYHLIGVLLAKEENQTESYFEELCDLYRTHTKSEFVCKLKERIINEIDFEDKDKTDFSFTHEVVEEYLKSLSYSDKKIDKDKIRNILLLFNVISMQNNTDSDPRFPFDSYQKQKWDIEHIHSVTTERAQNISWKRLLRIQSNEKNGTYQNRRKMFFSLIKDPLFDQNDIADSLQKICDRDVAGITDWRKYFITVPEIMDSLHKYTDGRASERYVRFEGKYIFLMGSTRLYGWNEEYYSYALYCLLKKLPNASVKYNQAKGWEDVDCHIELTSSTNAGKWKIKYLRAKDKFSVIDASGVQSLYSTVEDAKYALEKLL